MKQKTAVFLTTSLYLICVAAGLEAVDSENSFYQIKAACSKEISSIGEQARCGITITGDNPEKLEIEPPENEIFPEDTDPDREPVIPALTIDNFEKELNDDTLVVSFTVTPYRPGTYKINHVRITGNDGISIGYAYPEIKVKSVNPEGEFTEMEAPIEIKGSYFRHILILTAALALAGIAFFIIKKKLHHKEINEKEAAGPSPMELFEKDIRALSPEKLIDEQKAREYSFGISAAFRQLLFRQLQFNAPEMTSGEINSEIKKIFGTAFPRMQSDIKDLFALWDLAKYAEFSPSRDTLLHNLELAEKTAETVAGRHR